MTNGLRKAFVALSIYKALQNTCVKCFELKEFCNCNEFKSVLDNKISASQNKRRDEK